MQLITTIAAIAATAATARAQYANINNYCAFEVYVWPTDGTRNPTSGTPIPPGSNWNEPYQTAGGGVALKLSIVQSLESITMFEYDLSNTLGTGNPTVWYDGSNINCQTTNCPFWNYNLYIEASNPSCAAGPCPAQTSCPGFYQEPDDNQDTFSCPMEANTTMHLCVPDDLLPTGDTSVQLGPIGAPSPPAQPSSPSQAPSPPPAQDPPSSSAPPPATTPPPVQINQAIVETTITITTTTWISPRHAPRHAHGRYHRHA